SPQARTRGAFGQAAAGERGAGARASPRLRTARFHQRGRTRASHDPVYTGVGLFPRTAVRASSPESAVRALDARHIPAADRVLSALASSLPQFQDAVFPSALAC